MAPATLGVLAFDKKGRTTFTERMRQELNIDETTYVVVERTERGTIELVPATLVPKDQLWFHHPAVQARLARAESDFAEGRSTRTTTPEEAHTLLASLKTPTGQSVK
ncbi:MAG TPA: AbrB/MazE/SpoVT family DNA-binding domain-containing protein [Gemmatimonadaceae bacterium]|jgi:hypothetical protein|nr:AbrB/MazE/SpoVT family DNA-binding domain-containing protein [Gemmatimonadaceae bacterium]